MQGSLDWSILSPNKAYSHSLGVQQWQGVLSKASDLIESNEKALNVEIKSN